MNREPARELTGLVDMHIHAGPDVRPRLLDDLEAAAQAKAAGMRAILIKSHVTITADRAAIAEKAAGGGIRVFGSVALNYPVGGVNPAAVETALKLGAKVVWLPTVSARDVDGTRGTLNLWDNGQEGKLSQRLYDVIDLVAKADVVLATGHITIPEIAAAVKAARAAGVRKVVVSHPDSFLVDMPLALQQDLAAMGAYFDRCYLDVAGHTPGLTMAKMAHCIRTVGVGSTVLTSDFGRADRYLPVAGFRDYLNGLAGEGLSAAELQQMAATSPAMLLGL